MPRICAHFWVNLPGIISQEKDCVETFNNENDQVDALKRFFAENGKALAVGVILGLAHWLAGATGPPISRIPPETRRWLTRRRLPR
ncbi:membrane protein [Klebsiella pneumoniae]|uniref:Membrane protein n=1 Tax=Klebsiella pneumoniae TaxID=573 RepID=A0A377V780_KLEPN|nr:membrane protein [Klebsiella pneumoniae]